MTKEEPNSLSLSEKIELINQFQKLNPNGTIILSGGETMKKTDEFFSLSNLGRELNMSLIANTNGSFIRPDNYEMIFTHGPEYLIISIDGSRSEIHDYIRGVKGSFDSLTKMIRELTKLKREKFPDSHTKIITSTVLFDKNIELCDEYISFARNELKVDGVLFQCLIRTYQDKSKSDPFYAANFFKDKEKTGKILQELSDKYGNDDFVLTKNEDFKWMKIYVDHPDFSNVDEQVCISHEKNIIIDQYGNYNLCFNMNELTDIPPLGNTREMNLEELWTSQNANFARDIMSTCKMDCAVLNCHRKNSTVSI
jgi:MoaA/NifB/PqqE/SkfB family radical SAM enzyme